MTASELRPGQIVKSVAGRDRGRLMVVLGAIDERFVLVADGELRKAQRPKKKNVRHLQPEGGIVEAVARKVQEGRPVTDQELRDALRSGAADAGDRTPA